MGPSDNDKEVAASGSINGSKESTGKKGLNDLVAGIRSLVRKKKVIAAAPEEEVVCCNGIVHIAYRGVADDRMYISYSRKWNEIRFFRPNGLKVFCADCRHRVL